MESPYHQASGTLVSRAIARIKRYGGLVKVAWIPDQQIPPSWAEPFYEEVRGIFSRNPAFPQLPLGLIWIDRRPRGWLLVVSERHRRVHIVSTQGNTIENLFWSAGPLNSPGAVVLLEHDGALYMRLLFRRGTDDPDRMVRLVGRWRVPFLCPPFFGGELRDDTTDLERVLSSFHNHRIYRIRGMSQGQSPMIKPAQG